MPQLRSWPLWYDALNGYLTTDPGIAFGPSADASVPVEPPSLTTLTETRHPSDCLPPLSDLPLRRRHEPAEAEAADVRGRERGGPVPVRRLRGGGPGRLPGVLGRATAEAARRLLGVAHGRALHGTGRRAGWSVGCRCSSELVICRQLSGRCPKVLTCCS